jgi:hypothetical protein
MGKITQAQCEQGLRTLIKAADIPTAAKILGYEKLNPVIKEKYPDAEVSGKMYSAMLHFAHQWRQEAREATEAANTNQG